MDADTSVEVAILYATPIVPVPLEEMVMLLKLGTAANPVGYVNVLALLAVPATKRSTSPSCIPMPVTVTAQLVPEAVLTCDAAPRNAAHDGETSAQATKARMSFLNIF